MNNHEMMMKDFLRRLIFSLILTVPILILSPLIQSFFGYSLIFFGNNIVLFILSTIMYLFGGWPFLKGIYQELKNRSPGMMTLIAVAISVAYFYSSVVVFGLPGKFFFWELATLIDVMLFGHYIEMRSVTSASHALEKLAELMPDTAHRIRNGEKEDIKLSEVQEGDHLLVKPGEKISADGIIIKGSTTINESMLTGESTPVSKKEDDKVIAGSLNGDSSIEIEVISTEEKSYLYKVMDLVDKAQKSKSKTQHLADRAAFYLTIVALSVGLITLFGWLILGQTIVYSIERMATVMVITCPHALGLAIPLVVAISTTLSARNGLIIRNRSSFEKARKISTVIFDKTGTLTKGTFGVSKIDVLTKEYDEKKILSLVASIEKDSEHPISQGIIEEAEKEDIELMEQSNVTNIKGEGIKGNIGGSTIEIVSPAYVKRNNIEIDMSLLSEETKETKVVVILDKKPIGIIRLSDQIRDESYETIKQLKKQDISCWMLTGDNESIAESVADELGLDGYFAEVLPNEKQDKVRKLQSDGQFVAMVGDGVNDAPALAQADVGVAIGSGTDVAVESADIVLVKNNPHDVVSMITFGKKTYNKMIQNLFWATGYNVVAIPLAAGVLVHQGIVISPAVGAALMSLSTVIVAINARLLTI